MTEEDVIAHIQRIFEETFDFAAPSPQTDILEDGVLDSLALVTLLLEVGLQLGTEMGLESLEIDDFRTIERIARLMRIPRL